MALASTSLPAPTVSPLNDGYRQQIAESVAVLNQIRAGAATVQTFDTLPDGIRFLADVAKDAEVPER